MIKPTPLHETIGRLAEETLGLISGLEEFSFTDKENWSSDKTALAAMSEHIRSDIMKIAVVGVIKSGKSTFVNSFTGKELVKRGAGVMTSITTRIQKGNKNKAVLTFKSWDQVNLQLQGALDMFPVEDSPGSLLPSFDIRRKKDRQYLNTVYQKFLKELPLSGDRVRPEILMIRYALQGFDDCENLVKADETQVEFTSKQFYDHKIFTTDPDKAFYVKDVCLGVYGKTLDSGIEIADCQGADSTDPAALAQVLTYLESAGLILYCISSRTGLRQSDITFLKQIQNFGLLKNTVFLINLDLTEHEDMADLKRVEDTIRRDLKMLDMAQNIFSFSFLYDLFSKRQKGLTKKELAQRSLWNMESSMSGYSETGADQFRVFLDTLIEKTRTGFLVSTHLNRMRQILSRITQYIEITARALSSEKSGESDGIQDMEALYQNASRLESVVANSVEGAVSGLKEKVKTDMQQLLSLKDSLIYDEMARYIKSVSIDMDAYKTGTDAKGFNRVLYLMFQDFKRGLHLFEIEKIRPLVNVFVEEQEDKISSYFQSLLDSYRINLVPGQAEQHPTPESMDFKTIKKILGLTLPDAICNIRYTSRIKAGLFSRFGIKTLAGMLASVFSGKKSFSFSPGLQTAGQKIKETTLGQLEQQCSDYQDKLYTFYFLPMIEAATREFEEIILRRFSYYKSFKLETTKAMDLKNSRKTEQKKKLFALKPKVDELVSEVNKIAHQYQTGL